jgi:hypothetical protein
LKSSSSQPFSGGMRHRQLDSDCLRPDITVAIKLMSLRTSYALTRRRIIPIY